MPLALAAALCVAPRAFGELVDFGSDRWIMRNAEVSEHLGRTSLAGFAYLDDVDLADGVIEVDVALTGSPSYPCVGARSYPGILFRVHSDTDHERFYIRPHRAPFYPDALQYTPVFNGIAGWQLYNGEGYTAGAEIPAGEWVHLTLEMAGTQARVYIGDSETPALVMTDLKHGATGGSVGVMGPGDGTAYFSNFEYRADGELVFDPPPAFETPPGVVTNWEISPAYTLGEVDLRVHPEEQGFTEVPWTRIESDATGLVDVARHAGRLGRAPDCVFARTTLRADEQEIREIQVGYSDAVSVFLNGEPVFTGTSAYRQRDPSFLGIVGLFDALYLPLEAGENEVLLIVAESFGGWGFMCRDGDAVFLHEDLTEIAKTGAGLLTPEAVVYDPRRDVFYVSNYDAYDRAPGDGAQFLSRVTTEGEIAELVWIDGLDRPTGMALADDTLFVVERTGVAKIDLASGEIVGRIALEGAGFPNDIAIDSDGRLYVSDSSANTIIRIVDGIAEAWLIGGEISRPNGLHVDGDRLVVGNNGDGTLKGVDLATGEVSTIVALGEGIIDGVSSDAAGNLLVSHNEGKLYRIAPSGEIEKLADTTGPGVSAADFAYSADRGLLAVPTFVDDRVVLYRLAE